MKETENSQVKLEFEGEMLEKVNALKQYYGVKNNAELMRILINKQARDIGYPSQPVTAN